MREIRELINDYMTDEEVAPGLSVALIKGGKCVYKESHGFSNLENKIKIHSKTNFYLASVSKTFTAAAIMLLHEKKALNVYEKLNRYFPELPDSCKDIKIINLINHTSGLKDYFDYFIKKEMLYDVTNKDVYNFISLNNDLEFPVGTMFQYSNTGYVLLSMLVEKISDTSFNNFLKEHIFLPLGMKNTYVFTPDKPIVSNRGYGYKEINGKYHCDDYSILTTGDGGIYSNIDDLILWHHAFDTEKVFSADTREKIFSTEEINQDTRVNYGFGWFIQNRHNKKVAFHDGSAFGFRTLMGKSIDDDLAIIILANCYKKGWEKIYKRCSFIISELNNYELRQD